jgi:hypothetical protein
VPDELPPEEDPDEDADDDAAADADTDDDDTDDDDTDDDDQELSDSDKAALRAATAGLQAQSDLIRQMTSQLSEQLDALHPQTAPFREMSEIIAGSVDASGVQDVVKAFRATLPVFDFPQLRALQTQLAQVFADVDWSRIQQAWRRGLPSNWRDLGDDLRFGSLLEITEDGYPTAWVPRASILRELIAADKDDRQAVFAARRVEIIEDCCACLEEVTSAELIDLTAKLDEALEVAEAGRHLAAAQALAASVFDTVLRRTIKPQRIAGYYGKAKKEIEDRHETASLAELRWGVVHLPVLVALDVFDGPKGQPIPTSFNRHASAHAVGPEQYTEANAVIALALATSLVREAHQEIEDAADASTMP